jgi:sporulation protein YlmC with PRC-barrel domain
MQRLTYTAILFALMTTAASAQAQQAPAAASRQDAGPAAQIMTSIPQDSLTVTNWYKQSVYDPSDNKIGEIVDVLMDGSGGKVNALIIGVGGFLGIGEKDVAVPFNSVRATNKDNKWYLMMNTTKDALKSAKGFKYDRNAMTWMPEDAPATTGAQNPPPARPSNR